MAALAFDSRLAQEVTGTTTIPTERFEKVLGDNALAVWDVLCVCRNRNGYTTITYAGIQKKAALNDKQIARALVRLRRAGLVLDLLKRRKKMMRPVGRTGRMAEVWAFPRRVYGARGVNFTGKVVIVPGRVWRWLRRANYRGGARKGAGRPKGPMGTPQHLAIATRYRGSVRTAVLQYFRTGFLRKAGGGFPDYAGIIAQLGPCPGPRREYHIDHIRPLASFNLEDQTHLRQAFAPENHQWLTATENLRKSIFWVSEPGECVAPSNQTVPYTHNSKWGTDIDLNNSGFEGSVDVPSFASQKMAHSVASQRPADGILKAQQPGKSQGNVGSRIGGSRRRAPPPAGVNGVPQYPGPLVINPATVPGPPKLPDGLSNTDSARWLAKAYQGAIESRYKERCFVLRGRGKLENSKHLKLLMEAAELMREYDMAPAAWACFSIDGFRHVNDRGKPPIQWVYKHERLEEYQGWFRREAPHYSSKRVVYPKPAQDLIKRYGLMRVDLARTGAQTRQEVQVVVDKWFPDGLYDRLAEEARARAAEDQVLINRRVARGDWLGW